MNETIFFAVPGPLRTRTGGSIYDRRIVEGLRSRGRRVEVLELPGTFPDPSWTDRERIAARFLGLPAGATLIVDGLVLGGLPELAARVDERGDLVALVHHPLADEGGLDANRREALERSETRALAHARRVIVTSHFTARRLEAFGVAAERVDVVSPGTDPAPLARGGESAPALRLLCAASLVPRKGHAELLRALAGLGELNWHLDCVGKVDLDPTTAASVRSLRDALGLHERVRLHGEVARAALGELYVSADLFVLASRYEGFGMVVHEAIAHGLPVVTTTGGALAETLPRDAGLAVPPGDVDALRGALRRVLEDGELRARLGAGARRAREHLGSWQAAARAFDAALSADSPR